MPAARMMETSLSSVSLLPRDRMAAMTWLRFAFVKTSGTRGAYGIPHRLSGSLRGGTPTIGPCTGGLQTKAVGLWFLAAFPDCVLARVRNRQSSEGHRSQRPRLPQESRSEPGKIGREGRATSCLRQPGGVRHQSRLGGGALENLQGIEGADVGAVPRRVMGWGA